MSCPMDSAQTNRIGDTLYEVRRYDQGLHFRSPVLYFDELRNPIRKGF